eukprot:361917-Chlamydomonas_euryale.AAC.10
MHACVRACVRACVQACMCVCKFVRVWREYCRSAAEPGRGSTLRRRCAARPRQHAAPALCGSVRRCRMRRSGDGQTMLSTPQRPCRCVCCGCASVCACALRVVLRECWHRRATCWAA